MHYALHGDGRENFDFDVLLEHVYELKDAVKGGLYAIIDQVQAPSSAS